VKLPSGYYFTYGGQFENLQMASARLMIAVPISLFLIFLLLYFTFHSFKQALLIFTAIPMSAIGGVFALLIRDMPFSISAGVGFIALFGVAVLNGIVLIGKFNQLEKEGVTDIIKRVKEGTEVRLRPVLMTATVASLGFLPMAISTSAGAEVQKPLATVVIGGLTTATVLTLFVLPLLYIIFNSKLNFKSRTMKTTASIIALFFVGLSSVNAQQKISIDEAIQITLENNKGIKSNELEIQATESLLKTASELPKTELNFQYGQNDGFEQNDAISIAQNIPFPTLFKSRRELIKEQIKEKSIAKDVGIIELKQQLRSFFYQIAYLENNEKELKSLDSIYRDFLRIAEVRYNAGDTKKVDINTAEAKRGEINLLLRQNEIFKKNAYNNLKNLMQVQYDFSIEIPEVFEPIKISEIIDSSKINDHPQIQALYQQARIAEASKKVEKSSGLPEFNIGYTNASLMGMHERNGIEKYYGRGQRFSSFDVGIAIPLTYGSTKAKLRSLDFEKQASEMAADWKKQQLQNDFQNLMNQYEQNIAQYNYFKENALPNANEIINAAKLGYSAGDISYVEYLFALQTTTDIYLNYLRSIQSVNESVISINSLINQ
jgi:cobalt-zinc-cadmium resistance protein CzcA